MKTIGPYIKIVCEGGKTEPNYFNGWLRSKGFKLPNPAFKAKDHSPKGVAKEAKNLYKEALTLKIPPDQIHIWAVFDCDGHAGIPEAFDLLKPFPIKIAFSNVCFEFWILLHFQRTSRQFQNCDALVNFIQNEHDPNYAKSNDHFYRLKDKIPTAIENAKWLNETYWQSDNRPAWERNPYTDVYQILLSLG